MGDASTPLMPPVVRQRFATQVLKVEMQFVPRGIHRCETRVVGTAVEANLDDIRDHERCVRHHFELFNQSMEGELRFDAEDCAEAKRRKRRWSQMKQICSNQDTTTSADAKRVCETKSTRTRVLPTVVPKC